MIINLTQHAATPEQLAAGVVEPAEDAKQDIRTLLTFDVLPTRQDIDARAHDLAAIATMCATEDEDAERGEQTIDAAMIGGAPYLMPALEAALKDAYITPLYAFSKRESKDVTMPDGSVRKISNFRFLGFVQA